MIHGVGVDIVHVPRMERNLERFGERFARRILDEIECVDFRAAGSTAHFLAKRFAAKEAFAKALGTGFRDGLSPRQVGVRNDALGRPGFVVSGRARELMAQFSISAAHLSLSDEKDYALASVTLERS